MRSTITFSFLLALAHLIPNGGKVCAQVNVPFQVNSGSGTLDRFPTADDVKGPGIPHDIETGMVTIDGVSLNYTGMASFRILAEPDKSLTAPFESDDPMTFDFGGGNTFQMHYGREDFGAPTTGFATLTPDPTTGLFDILFLATFTYVPGSGTGEYADIIDGEIFMTANATAVDLTMPDLPYSWSSDVGFLTIVPEPVGIGFLLLGFTGMLRLRSRQRN